MSSHPIVIAHHVRNNRSMNLVYNHILVENVDGDYQVNLYIRYGVWVNLVKPVKNSLRKKDECAKSIIVDFKMESVESVLVSVLNMRLTALLKNVSVDVATAACKSVSGSADTGCAKNGKKCLIIVF